MILVQLTPNTIIKKYPCETHDDNKHKTTIRKITKIHKIYIPYTITNI